MKHTTSFVAIVALACGHLAGGLAHAQVNAIFNPGVPSQYTFTCTNTVGQPVSNCQITLSVAAIPQTNGHFHEGPPGYPTPTHPVSGLCAGTCNAASTYSPSISGCSDSNGNFTFTIKTTLVGQFEVLTGTSSNQNGCTAAYPLGQWAYAVGYGDLIHATSAAWKPVGGSDTGGNTGHGTTQYNHYMLPATANALAATTAVWAQQTGNCMICINDAALPLSMSSEVGRQRTAHNRTWPWCQPSTMSTYL